MLAMAANLPSHLRRRQKPTLAAERLRACAALTRMPHKLWVSATCLSRTSRRPMETAARPAQPARPSRLAGPFSQPTLAVAHGSAPPSMGSAPRLRKSLTSSIRPHRHARPSGVLSSTLSRRSRRARLGHHRGKRDAFVSGQTAACCRNLVEERRVSTGRSCPDENG
jgi:hypothetical protein